MPPSQVPITKLDSPNVLIMNRAYGGARGVIDFNAIVNYESTKYRIHSAVC